jgi:arylsulfatase A-like enzyme
MPNGKPNILVIWGDDIGISNLSCYSDGVTPRHAPTSFSVDQAVENYRNS